MVLGGGTAIAKMEMYRISISQLQIREQRLNLSASQQQGHSNTYNTLF